MTAEPAILTLNGGSSSIKFALFSARAEPARLFSGEVEGIGSAHPVLRMARTGREATVAPAAASDHGAAARLVLAAIEQHIGNHRLLAVGHRIVHGGPDFVRPQRIGPDAVATLRRLTPLDPEHLPLELALVEAATSRFPDVAQVACFDTAFHHTMPRVAKLLPIPLRYAAKGVVRYGFHGLSYTYLMGEVVRLSGTAAARARIILAHLGSGASLAAVKGGTPVDTSMGFTPASGVPMATRSGDIDPGLAAYLARTEGMDMVQFDHMANFASGLLGLSETSADIRDLLAREASDARAADAVASFCYAVKQRIGAFAATLGGIDLLVFSGGVGANTPVIRARICDGLGFLGIAVDDGRNAAGAAIISPEAASVVIRVMATDEEVVIARAARDLVT